MQNENKSIQYLFRDITKQREKSGLIKYVFKFYTLAAISEFRLVSFS